MDFDNFEAIAEESAVWTPHGMTNYKPICTPLYPTMWSGVEVLADARFIHESGSVPIAFQNCIPGFGSVQ